MVRRDYTAEEIGALSLEEAWALPDGGLRITFKTGEVNVYRTRQIIASWYYMQLHRWYPGSYTTPKQIVDEMYMTNSHVNAISETFWDIWENSISKLPTLEAEEVFWKASESVYTITNWIYNDMIINIPEYTSTLDWTDFDEILLHPEVLAAKAVWKANPNKFTHAECWDQIFNIIKTHKDFAHNEIQAMLKSDTCNKLQLMQMIVRGFIMDSDGTTFKTPIVDGYADGMNSNYERQIESRTAAISLYMASAPLEDSEYNNRVCQFFCGIIGKVEHDDCGAEHYLVQHVTPKNFTSLRGKYIRENENQPWRMLFSKPEDKYLIGKFVHMRSITTCGNSDPTRPCHRCIGLIAWIIPPGTSVGACLTISPLGGVSQNILGAKHIIASPNIQSVSMSGDNGRFLAHDSEDEFLIKLRPSKTGKALGMTIDSKDAFFLNDVNVAKDIDELTVTRISEIQTLIMHELGDNGESKNATNLNIAVGGGGCHLSREFLIYLRDYSWILTNKDKIFIDLSHWDFEETAFIVPRRAEDITEILTNLKYFMEAPQNCSGKRIIDMRSTEEAVDTFWDLMYDKTGINIVHAEVFVRAHMVRDTEDNRGYQMPIGGEPYRFVSMLHCLPNRGSGVKYAYESQQTIAFTPSNYLLGDVDIPALELDKMWV